MEQDRGKQQGHTEKKASLKQRWGELRPTKTWVFWSWVVSIVLTMIIGFTWGGWVTAKNAQNMAEKMAQEAVASRLAPMCVIQFQQDPGKDQKLAELKAASTWARSDYIQKQGWATMFGEEKPDRNVADACANLLIQLSQTTSSLAPASTSHTN